MPDRVVVTGGTGHIGCNLVRMLLEHGARVCVVTSATGPVPSLAALDVELVRADVRDGPALERIFAGADVVYHLAAVISIDGDPTGIVRDVNVGGARTAATAALAAGVRRFVHTSSVHAFDHGPLDEPLDETRSRPTPRHPAYDRSKAEGEAAVREVSAQGLDVVIVNPTGVIGPNDFVPSQMGALFLELARRAVPVVPAGGFDWVDVRDVAASMIAAAERGRTGENYLLGGHWHTLRELALLAEPSTGVAAPREVPLSLMTALAHGVSRMLRVVGRSSQLTPDAMAALRSNRRVRSDKAARELGHTARPIAESVRDLYASFRERTP